MATPELLAAVSAAVKGEDPPAGDPPADPPAGDDAPADPPAGDDPPADPPAGDDSPADPPAGDPPADGPVRDANGRFVAKKPDGEPAAADPAAAKPADPKAAKPADPPKPPDHLNDPIPDTVKAATRERITSLVESVKAVTGERDTFKQDLDALLAPITAAGASLEQFNESMNLVKLLNSPHQHEQMQALEYLQGATAALAERLGHVLPGMDPLEGYPDLVQAVHQKQMTPAGAAEVARSRRQLQASQRFMQDGQQRTQSEQQRQQAVAAGQNALKALEQSLQEANPTLYKARVAIMRADTAFTNKLRAMPPGQWAGAFAEHYRTVKVAPPAAAPTTAPAARSPAPLRGKTPAGTAAKPPGSMLEAVKAGLGALRTG